MVFANQKGEAQGAFADRRLKAFAETIGLEMSQFNSCFDRSQYAANVDQDLASGAVFGVRGTPSIFINNQQIPNNAAMDFNQLSQYIETELAK